VKYRILKIAVVIGLVASSSLAVAEGKFVYKQPLQGVDASPTFGMNQSEIDKYKCYQEERSIVQEVEYVTKYKREKQYGNWSGPYSSYWSNGDYISYSVGLTTSRDYYAVSWRGSRAGQFSSSTTPYSGMLWDSRSSVDTYYQYKFGTCGKGGNAYTTCTDLSRRLVNTESVPYQEETLVDKIIKTENYDWCVTNGYETAN